MTPESLMTQGLIAGRGAGGGLAPDPSCLELDSYGNDWVKMLVIPPVDTAFYVGTKVYYAEVTSCTYSEAGPEDAQDMVTIAGLTEGTIYVFLPVAYGTGGTLAKPGNAILMTVPENLVDMEGLQLNSCGLEDVWAMIREKVNRSQLVEALKAADLRIAELQAKSELYDERLERLKAQIAAIRRELP
jgi:hypothetical protein